MTRRMFSSVDSGRWTVDSSVDCGRSTVDGRLSTVDCRRWTVDLTRSAFTLIELTIVIVVIGILAAVAIPRYLSLLNEAKLSTTKAILGNVRSAVMIFRADRIVRGVDSLPTLEDMQDNPFNTGCDVLETGDLPDNPFSTGPDKDAIIATVGRPTPTGTGGAWAYDAGTGGFYANTKSGQGEELL